jgi:hypothetical protein
LWGVKLTKTELQNFLYNFLSVSYPTIKKTNQKRAPPYKELFKKIDTKDQSNNYDFAVIIV